MAGTCFSGSSGVTPPGNRLNRSWYDLDASTEWDSYNLLVTALSITFAMPKKSQGPRLGAFYSMPRSGNRVTETLRIAT
jgi:hypothetical protein